MFDHRLKTYDSGLTVITVPMPGVSSVTVLAMANTGSRYEQPREEGIAHFFEHMVFKGTANYPTALDMSKAIDEIGADANAFTSKEYTGYYVKSATKHFERALDLVSDMMLTPKLRQEDIDREKGVIIEEINMYKDTPTRHIQDLFEEMVYRGSGLSHNIAGRKSSVSALRRRDFVKFLKHWYGLGNLVVILAGNTRLVNSSATLKQVQKAFKKQDKDDGVSIRAKGRVDISNFFDKKQKRGPYSSKKLHFESRKTEQAHLIMGWPGLDRSDERRYALTVLGTIMGGNMSSRLFSEVREKRGLCYYVRSDVDFYHDAGILGASAGVDPKRIDEALRVIRDEFEALASGEKKVTSEELKKAKEYIVGSTTLSFEDSRSVAQYFGLREILHDQVESPSELIKRIRAVKASEVHQVAKDLIIPGELRLAVIGPYRKATRFNKFLKTR